MPSPDELWDSEPIDHLAPEHEGMVLALGTLVTAGARAEAALRASIYAACSLGDSTWLFTEGESVDWLLQKLRFIAEEDLGKDADVLKTCSSAKSLFEERNRFIHAEMCVTQDGHYVTLRSRRHKQLRPQLCQIRDVMKLAEDLKSVGKELVRAAQAASHKALESPRVPFGSP